MFIGLVKVCVYKRWIKILKWVNLVVHYNESMVSLSKLTVFLVCVVCTLITVIFIPSSFTNSPASTQTKQISITKLAFRYYFFSSS